MNENYLTESEKQSVIAFCANKPMFDAVKKVLLATIYHQGIVRKGEALTEFNWVFSITNSIEPKSDEQLGQELRASIAALNYLKGGFERLLEFKVDEPKKPKKNPAL